MIDLDAIRRRAEAAAKFCEYCLVRVPAVADARSDIPAMLAHIEKLEAVREAATAYIDLIGFESDEKWCRLDDALAAVEEA